MVELRRWKRENDFNFFLKRSVAQNLRFRTSLIGVLPYNPVIRLSWKIIKLKRFFVLYHHNMKFILFTLFACAVGYKVETVSTVCFFVNSECHKSHAKEVQIAINNGNQRYLSHSTTTTKSGMHTMIVYN